MQPQEINIISKDGIKIPAFIYNYNNNNSDNNASEPAKPKGIVIIIHGFGEHAGGYREAAERLAQANYISVVFDQRGHGNMPQYSTKQRKKYFGVIPSYQSFLEDIDAAAAELKRQNPGIPVVIYAHSMGGNIAADYLLTRSQSDFSCAVLESPWFGLYREVNPFMSAAASVLGRLLPNTAIVTKLPPCDVTGDKTKSGEMEKDPLYHNRISFGMFDGINKACKYILNNASKLSVPIFLAYAKNEKIVSNPAIQKFYGSCGDNVKIKEYESSHAIHNDAKREDFYNDMIAFIDEHCK